MRALRYDGASVSRKYSISSPVSGIAGLAAAKAQGRTGGRPTVMDADKLAAARARRARGESPAKIAKALGISRASIYRHLPAVGE